MINLIKKNISNMINKSENVVFNFLTIGKVQESQDAIEIKRYYGNAFCNVIAVNPTREEIAKLTDRNVEDVKEPKYIGTMKDMNGTEHQYATIVVWLKTIPEENNGIETIFQARFTIQNNAYVGSTSGKKQIIDKYGNTGWATEDEIKEHKIPMYKNGPANMDSDYRIAYRGEEDLVNFLRNYLWISTWKKYINEEWVLIDNVEDAELRLEKVADYFKGDFSEIKNAINMMPNNKVLVIVGIRNVDGNLYASVYTKSVLKSNANTKTINKVYAEINDAKARGSHANTDFINAPLMEYIVKSTDFSKEQPKDLPFDNNQPASNLPFNNVSADKAYNPFNEQNNTQKKTNDLPF